MSERRLFCKSWVGGSNYWKGIRVGQIPPISGALRDILALEARLDTYDDSIHNAIEALEALSADLLASRGTTESQSIPKSPRGRELFCSVRFLGSVTIYDPSIEAAYLVCDGKLLRIDKARPSREYTHWRVKLVGSTVQIPVSNDAPVYVTPDFNLSGKTLEECKRG